MFSADQASRQITEIASGHISVEDFRDWFRNASRNFHSWGDEQAKQIAFEIEGVLSEYHFSGLNDFAAIQALEDVVRPFVEPPEEIVSSNRAANTSDPPFRYPASGNTNIGFNVAA